ncbi:MAG TPA: SDR family NAD(P)-dependent oxidoreductase [Baekduia sp.]|uniref:SDR family NAD(P)-dependent oxidoreductase n=1 Tax=Baekduia sp. TaxID=2600305 RepID=UPI002D772A1A|nr:SDR family NAD(P)-dependent oxidoreductase [Baekduia sp.]HET6509039.1 SDR family NAD(P)-dependent oxidoreductase [Baekduia sp.]
MSGRLEGKTAIITGTGGGQGREAALLFAAEGARIIGCDLKADGAEETVAMVRERGGTMHSTHPLDLGDRDAVRAWVEETVRDHGPLDILYNNASAPRFGSIGDLSAEDWSTSLRNELDVVFHVTQAVWPHLVARGGGSIVNIASMQGINAITSAPGGFVHAAAKHGVIGMTRELALEGGPHGIRVNAISPGLIISPATEAMTEAEGLVEAFLAHQIVKRAGLPQDIAKAALFLVSDDAAFITGENLVVDGGYTVV